MFGFKALFFLVFCLLFCNGPTQASDGSASCDEAKKTTEKAAEFIKAHGLKKSYQAFHDKTGPFQQRGLYVFVVNDKGINEIHPVTPSLQHRNVLELKDIMGFPLGRAIMNVKKISGYTINIHGLIRLICLRTRAHIL